MNLTPLDDVSLVQDERLRRCVFLAGLVVMCYDYLLTLELEVTHMWETKLKRSSAWFFLVRYVALGGNIALAVYFLGNLDAQVCRKLSVVENILLVVQETFVEVTLAIRVSAMYKFSRRVFVALAFAAVLTISLAVWAITGPDDSPAIIPILPGCHVATGHQTAIRMAAAWEAQLFCDILILGLTLRRAYMHHSDVACLGSRMSLFQTMVRDGVLYFGMICVVYLANIIMLYTGDVIMAGSLAWFASSVSVTMVSRLMLNLHRAATGNWMPSYSQSEVDAQVKDLVAPNLEVGVADSQGTS
ncbi:hypothetical protein FB45DRAFT_277737 [Roridomyces roridus]|uniref:DUF6533 domain-containing protein n=1 Tax=Roridomyces roridus TaxID=1738132 RepID=A0AAD7C9W9_9AGAR|nr:hypothetical protein FB45DRAFT_277737 [Roridomyces roridus]